jgi:hypothetical protein
MSPDESTAPPDPSRLCLECGVCCGESMFSWVVLQPAEVDPLRAAGSSVVFRDGADGRESYMALPCVLWKEHRCSVYDSIQPLRCSEFRCKLLRAYVGGERGFDESITWVQRVRELEQEIRSLGGVPRVGSQAVGAAKDLDAHQQAALMAVFEHDLVLSRYFKSNPDEETPTTDTT